MRTIHQILSGKFLTDNKENKYMKKMLLVLATTSLISVSAYATTLHLGERMIGSGQHYPQSASLSLKPLKEGFYYDITCTVINPDAKAYPMTAAVDITNLPLPARVLFDGDELSTKQMRLKDNNEHTIKFPRVITYNTNSEVVFTWLDGEGVADPLHFNCHANASHGLNK